MLYRFDGRKPVVGAGTYVSETASVIGDVRIGSNCYVGHGAVLRGDYGTIEVGDETAVEEGVIVHAPPNERCAIGRKVVLGHGAIIHAATVGDSVTVGMGAILSLRSEVGSHSIVAEGAVVKRGQKIPHAVVAAGNPAKKVREVSEEEKEYGDFVTGVYTDLAQRYLAGAMEKIETPSSG